MQALVMLIWQGISFILGKFVQMAGFMITLAIAIFTGAWLLGTDLGCWLLDQALSLVEVILNSVAFDFSVFDLTQYMTALPAEVTNMLSLIGLGTGLGIILAAIGIKVLLQLIPFTRLGS